MVGEAVSLERQAELDALHAAAEEDAALAEADQQRRPRPPAAEKAAHVEAAHHGGRGQWARWCRRRSCSTCTA